MYSVSLIFPEDPYDRLRGLKLQIEDGTTLAGFRARLVSGEVLGMDGISPDSFKLIHKGRPLSLTRGADVLKNVLLEAHGSLDFPIYCLVPKESWKVPASIKPPLQTQHPSPTLERPAMTPPEAYQAGLPSYFDTPQASTSKTAFSPKPAENGETTVLEQDTSEKWANHRLHVMSLDLSSKAMLHTSLLMLADYLIVCIVDEAKLLGLPLPAELVTHSQRAMKLQSQSATMEARAESLADTLDLRFVVDAFQNEVDADVKKAEASKSQKTSTHSRVVDICGQSYLLHVPPSFAEVHIDQRHLFRSLRTHQAYLTIVKSLQSILDTSQRQRLLASPPRILRTHTEPGMVPRLPQAGIFNPNNHQPPPTNAVRVGGVPRANAIAVVINLDEIRRTLLPLFWISIKLSFMLYVFGRHASQPKRIVMGIMALGWILWEAFSLRGRRAAEGRRQMQAIAQGQGQLREVPNQQPAAPQPAQPAQPPVRARHPQANAQAFANLQPGVIFQRAGRDAVAAHPPAERRHRHRSMWTSSYYINRIAGIGLATEARAMGINDLSRQKAALTARINNQPVHEHRERVREDPSKSWLWTLTILMVLFFGTFIPEVERRRKRAVEKRDRLLRQLKEEVAALEKELAEKPAVATSQTVDRTVHNNADNGQSLLDRLNALAEDDSRAPSPAPVQRPMAVPAPDADLDFQNDQEEAGEHPEGEDDVGLLLF